MQQVVTAMPLDGVEWDKIRSFSRKVAALPIHSPCAHPIADYREVGKRAGQCVQLYCRETDPFNTENPVLAQRAVAAGWLFYALEHHGLSYEDLLENVGQTLANDVALLSPDIRVPIQRRWLLWQGELLQAAEYVRWVVIAETIARSERLLSLIESEDWLDKLGYWLPAWVKSRQELLGSMQYWKGQTGMILAVARLAELEAQLPAKGRIGRHAVMA